MNLPTTISQRAVTGYQSKGRLKVHIRSVRIEVASGILRTVAKVYRQDYLLRNCSFRIYRSDTAK